jgi:hypothetical protein
MQNKEDLDLNAFFSNMRAIDEEKSIPPLPDFHKRQIPIWKIVTGLGIAASILLGTFFFSPSQEKELTKDTVIIKLVEREDGQQEFQIETASSIDIWESPSNSLLELDTP